MVKAFRFSHFFFWIIFIFSLLISTDGTAQVRVVRTLNTGWKFYKGANAEAEKVDCSDKAWQDITIPHDWAIAGPFIPDGDGSTGKLPWKGEGWYRYHLKADASLSGKKVFLVFDGVMAFPRVYVNGILAGQWDYGYASFWVDITPYFRHGEENVIAVHADTRQHDSRWYPGAGIYRKVQLIATDPVHMEWWGAQVSTPILKKGYAKVNVSVPVRNESNMPQNELDIVLSLLSPSGKVLATNKIVSSIPGGLSKTVESVFTVANPQRWEVGKGIRYAIQIRVQHGTTILDEETIPFGIRSVRFTADDGFYLNDRRVQLNGVCLHHDQGPLGAAFYPRAMERQLELLQQMGCNAIRTSHNVPAPEVLDLCDRMGILVIDEIFDKYDGKADITDTTDFQAFTERNVRNFVTRDRNHPCIFLWSVGNEIGDVQWNKNGGFAKLATMVNTFRKYDITRPVTLVCDSRNSATLRHFDYYDVHSWNYGRRYDLARQLEPNKAVIISESASTVSTRGFYEWPLPEKKTDFTKSLQVSSYDLNAPDWAEIPDDDFMWQEEENYVAGEFVWTGFDYIGEPTPYENSKVKAMGYSDKEASVSSYFGIFDLVGFPKDRYYLYKSHWNESDTTIHILPHWNWPGKEGQKIPVFVYTNGDCAELFINGKSQGMQCKQPDASMSTKRYRLMWPEVIYQPGEVKAMAYRGGEILGEANMETTNAPNRLRLSPDRTHLQADGMDLCYLAVEVLDDQGRVCPVGDQLVKFQVKGPANIAGLGNGNPQSMESFQSNEMHLFNGKLMVILRSGVTKGTVKITATAEGLHSGEISIDME